MPFLPDQPVAPAIGTIGVAVNDRPDPEFLDLLGAAYRQDNLIGSYFTDARRTVGANDFYEVDKAFNPFENLSPDLEQHAIEGRFDDVYNRQAFDLVVSNIRKEEQDRQTLAAGGWTSFVLSGLAGVTDPTILLPGGAFVRAGKVGYSTLRTGVSVGAAAAAATAVQEAGLQATQETRSLEESAIAVGGSAILGGLIGMAGAKFMSHGEWSQLGKRLEEELAGDVENPAAAAEIIVQRMQSAGADVLDTASLEDLGVGGPRAAQAVAKATAALRINPGLETMFSPSRTVREVYGQLVDNPIYTSMNMDGRTLGAGVENYVKETQRGLMAQWLREANAAWREARRAGFKGTRTEFNEMIGKAGRRNDLDPNGNAYVTQLAQDARARIFNPLLERAKKNGLLPDDVQTTTAASYVSRLWNRQRLIAREDEFRKIAKEYLSAEINKVEFRQHEARIGNQIVQADIAGEQFAKLSEQVEGVDNRLSGRSAVRQRKVSELNSIERRMFTAQNNRPPAGLVASLRNADGNANMIAHLRSARAAQRSAASKRPMAERLPVLAMVKRKGGVKVGSPLALELNALGVNTKTQPGLFRSNSGLGALDNLPWDEEEIFQMLPVGEDGIYVDERALIDAIRNELAGSPIRTPDQIAADEAADAMVDWAARWLDELGLPQDATVADARKLIRDINAADRDADDLLARTMRLEKDLVDFDDATDKILNERAILQEQLDAAAKEMNALNEGILEVQDIAQASPRVSVIVEYAKSKRNLFKKRMDHKRLKARGDALKRLEAGGRINDELLNELYSTNTRLVALNDEIARLDAKVEKLRPSLPRQQEELPDFVSAADRDAYVDEAVTAVFNNLTGRGKGDTPEWLVPVTRGPLKERTFNIQDALVEDFLESDMELVLRHYTRKMGAEVELAEKFGRADMKDQFDAINKEYDDLSKAATTESERIKLDKARKRDLDNLAAFRDMVRGTYRAADEDSNWSRLTRAALTWNYIRLLGGVTVSSLTDAARLIGVHGVRATMREALPALVSNVRAVKLAKQEAKDFGVVAETVLQSRLSTLADLQDPYRYGSSYERMLSNASNIFSKATGLSWWNDTMKTMASVMTQNRMMRNSLNWSKMDKAEQAYMAYLGIDENMGQRIAAQFKRHGITEKGIHGANAQAWDDEVARRAWAAALAKDVDRTIITKGVTDTPLWMKSNWGRLIMQFKSFGLASHQRILIAGLQERPQRLAEQMVFASAIGMMIGLLKFWERGDLEEAGRLMDNPGLWVADGLDRTGILSLPFEISNTANKVGVPFGIVPAAQLVAQDPDRGGQASRYASRNKLGAVMGPSAGIFEDLTTIAQQLSTFDDETGEYEGLKRSGANAVLRQIPGASLPGARSVLGYFVRPAIEEAFN